MVADIGGVPAAAHHHLPRCRQVHGKHSPTPPAAQSAKSASICRHSRTFGWQNGGASVGHGRRSRHLSKARQPGGMGGECGQGGLRTAQAKLHHTYTQLHTQGV